MSQGSEQRSRWHFGRTWWMTILSICVEALLGIIAVHENVPLEQVAVPAAAVAAACASHNLGRAYEDGQRNKAGANVDVGHQPKNPEASK